MQIFKNKALKIDIKYFRELLLYRAFIEKSQKTTYLKIFIDNFAWNELFFKSLAMT